MEADLAYEPVIIGVIALVALLTLIVSLQRRAEPPPPAPARRFVSKGADRFVAQGRYEEAGRLAMIQNQWDEAVELYRMARKPDLAAAAARRAGKLNVAAELYELCGDYENATACRTAILERTADPSVAPPADAAPLATSEPAPLVPREVAIPRAPALPRLEPTAPREPAAAAPGAETAPEVLEGPGRAAAEGLPTSGKRSSLPPPFRSKPPSEDSSYSIVSSPPSRKRSSAPPKHGSDAPRGSDPRRVASDRPKLARATRPLGSKAPDALVSVAEVEAMVEELAEVGGLQRRRDLHALFAVARPLRGAPTEQSPGLETHPIDRSALCDPAVEEAKVGEELGSLLAFAQGQRCDLGNIEVYHRIGLAHLAGGNWEAAAAALEAVEDTSPGYRGADVRVAALAAWREAHAPVLVGLGEGAGARFDLLGELGRGPRAVVYLARDRESGHEVALKVLAARVAGAAARARLEQAVAAAASLTHPAICTVHGQGFVADTPYVATAVAPGLVLKDLAPALAVVEVLEVLVTTLEALAFAHRHDVLHGDLHLSNLIMGRSATITVTDFAIGAALGGPSDPQLAAPEAASERDARSDVYALGAIAHFLLSGHLPHRTSGGEITPIERVALPEVVEETVRKALAPRPVERWPSAAAMAQPLRAVLDAVRERAPGR